jgi:cell division protein FtsQ
MEKKLADYVPERANSILARQKSRETSRLRTYWKRTLLAFKWGMGGFALLLLATGGLLVQNLLLHSARFNTAIKEIQGLHYVSESQILSKVTEVENRSRNLLSLDLVGLRKSIEQIPWVSAVLVRRTLPNKLTIEITERRPIAFARVDATTLLVDNAGVLLEKSPEMTSQFDFPVIIGLESGYDREVLARNRERLARYQSLIQSLDENGAGLSKDLSEIYLRDVDNVSVILNDDTVLVHLGKTDFQQKFRHYLAMGKELKQKYPALDSVDLRFQNQIIVISAPREGNSGTGGTEARAKETANELRPIER